MEDRKEQIYRILLDAEKPIKGELLGEKFDVSRQVIVKDIALLRAEGKDIIATNRGYIIPSQGKLVRQIVCEHHTIGEIEEELKIIIDNGGKVRDVIVDHPVYGEIKTPLEIKNRRDIKDFLEDIEKSKGEPLSTLTDGVHIHTIEAEDEEELDLIEKELLEKNYLIK